MNELGRVVAKSLAQVFLEAAPWPSVPGAKDFEEALGHLQPGWVRGIEVAGNDARARVAHPNQLAGKHTAPRLHAVLSETGAVSGSPSGRGQVGFSRLALYPSRRCHSTL